MTRGFLVLSSLRNSSMASAAPFMLTKSRESSSSSSRSITTTLPLPGEAEVLFAGPFFSLTVLHVPAVFFVVFSEGASFSTFETAFFALDVFEALGLLLTPPEPALTFLAFVSFVAFFPTTFDHRLIFD